MASAQPTDAINPAPRKAIRKFVSAREREAQKVLTEARQTRMLGAALLAAPESLSPGAMRTAVQATIAAEIAAREVLERAVANYAIATSWREASAALAVFSEAASREDGQKRKRGKPKKLGPTETEKKIYEVFMRTKALIPSAKDSEIINNFVAIFRDDSMRPSDFPKGHTGHRTIETRIRRAIKACTASSAT